MSRKELRSPHGKETFRLIHGDALEVLDKDIAPGSIDVVVTSPPYNIGIQYDAYDDTIPRERYLDWVDAWSAKLAAALAGEGSFFLNLGAKPSDPWVPFEVAQVVRRHFQLQNVIHWIKSIAIDADAVGKSYGKREDLVAGHYKPVQSKRFLSSLHEYVFHWTRTGSVELDKLALGVPYKDKSNVARWKGVGRDLRCRGNVWFIPYDTIQRRSADRPHPSTFPVRLAQMCIRLHGRSRVRVVLDPFMGIGSAAVACVREKVSFIGIDLDAGYIETARRRLRLEMQKPSHDAAPAPPA